MLSNTSHGIDVVDREQLETIAEFDGRYLSMPKLVSKWTVQIDETSD